MSQTATTGPAMPSTTRRAGNSIKKLIGSTGPLMVLLILGIILWITAPAFRSPTSIMLLALEAAAIGVVAAGQTFVILTGGIDLSVEAMVSFSGVMAAILIAGTRDRRRADRQRHRVVAGYLDCRDCRRADRHVPGLADH